MGEKIPERVMDTLKAHNEREREHLEQLEALLELAQRAKLLFDAIGEKWKDKDFAVGLGVSAWMEQYNKLIED